MLINELKIYIIKMLTLKDKRKTFFLSFGSLNMYIMPFLWATSLALEIDFMTLPFTILIHWFFAQFCIKTS